VPFLAVTMAPAAVVTAGLPVWDGDIIHQL
jgi:hypothetical protein